MTNEELLKLYISDQAERHKLLQIKDRHEASLMKESILVNDAKRRELASDLMPELTTKCDVRDYFHAAVIFSRGNNKSDREKAYGYAKKAYSITRFQNSDFAEEVKDLYRHTGAKVNKQKQDATAEEKMHDPFRLKPKGPEEKSKKDEEKERENLKMKPRCFVCGKQHTGPCPPKK